MKTTTLLAAVLAATLTTAAATAPPLTSATAGVVEVGDVPEYGFRTPPVNSLGRTTLKDLRGAPVLVEFWGTR